MAKGSASEVRSMINLAVQLNYLNKDIATSYFEQFDEIRKILSGLINALKK
jgi:four helix bundle protein